jgi:very-short-patch-repair endonuclease
MNSVFGRAGIARYADLLRAGVTQWELRHAVAHAQIHRICPGWYALPGADRDVVRAVASGGSLTGPSAAKLFGLWVPPFRGLHVSVARGSSGHALAAVRSSQHCVHWRASRGRRHDPVESLDTVLLDCVQCMPEEMAIAVVDSALNKSARGRIPERLNKRDLLDACDRLPARYTRAIAKADPLSQSGIETLVRLRLRAKGISVTSQHEHPEVGHVDLLVGDRLVIEVDGRETHDTEKGFATDRQRDLILFRDDMRTLRLTYAHVMYDWRVVEPIILGATRRREHRWPRGSGRKTGNGRGVPARYTGERKNGQEETRQRAKEDI